MSTFILTSIPGLEAACIWISIPFSMVYIIILIRNFMILFVVTKEQTFHKPMYFLLCMLALTDIDLSIPVFPKALCIFWFSLKVIMLESCLTQIFFHFVFVALQSTVLVTMALDHYGAICDPLSSTTVLTNERIPVLGLLHLVRAILSNLTLPLLLHRLPFCSVHIIPDTYCERMALLKISCVDTAIIWTYSMMVALGNTGLDLIIIGLFYTSILWVVQSVPLKQVNKKGLNTCSIHIGVMLSSYTPILISALLYRVAQAFPAHVHVFLHNFCFLLPTMLNPIIFGVSISTSGYVYRKTRKNDVFFILK